MESWGDLLKDNPGNPAQLLSKLYSTNSEPPEIANRWKKRHHPRIQSASIVASVKRPRSNHPRHRLILGMEVHPLVRFFIQKCHQKKTHVHKKKRVSELVLPVFNGSQTLQENQLWRISSASNHTSFLQHLATTMIETFSARPLRLRCPSHKNLPVKHQKFWGPQKK